MRNPTILLSPGNALERTQSMCQQCDDIGHHRVAHTVAYDEVSAPGFEPVSWQPFRRDLQLLNLRALPTDVHDATFRDIPGRETCFFRAKAKICFLEV